jgi:hypothetical protein
MSGSCEHKKLMTDDCLSGKTYDEQKAVLVRNLKDVDSISLTTDTWTSK